MTNKAGQEFQRRARMTPAERMIDDKRRRRRYRIRHVNGWLGVIVAGFLIVIDTLFCGLLLYSGLADGFTTLFSGHVNGGTLALSVLKVILAWPLFLLGIVISVAAGNAAE